MRSSNNGVVSIGNTCSTATPLPSLCDSISLQVMPQFLKSIESLDGDYDLMVGNSFACSPLPYVKGQTAVRNILDGLVLTARAKMGK